MASTLIQSVFATTYKDDYKDSDNYHRILFNSGRALQARELTQLQTIIQAEIGRFGRNIFKEGASVNPGGATINSGYQFAKLNTATYTLPTSSIVGNIFIGQTSGIRAQILEVVAAEGSDPATIYINYIGGTAGNVVSVSAFTPGETITDGTNTLAIQTTNTTADPAIGTGVRFSCAAGDFFTRGHFVFNEEQSIIISKYNPLYTGVVGFIVTEDVVTVADNINLYDNQGATPNTTAPGADRYRIKLTLTDQANVDSDQTFVYFAKIVNSEIVNNVSGQDEYNKINDLLAKRTKEESGDYIVRPFTLKYDPDSDKNYLLADVSPGIAYINGYRVENNSPRQIRVQKPTTVEFFNNQAIAANYGNYVVCSTIKGTPLINTVEKWNLRTATGYGGSTIGTARVKAVEEDGAVYKYYLTDILMSGSNKFRDVRSIGVSATTYADLVLENSIAVIKDAANNTLLFPLPQSRPQNLSDISLQVQKRFTTTNASGTATLSPGNLGTGETWTDTNSWIITVDSSGENISSTVSVTGSGSTTATISGIPVGNGATIEVLAYIDKSAGTAATKTMVEATRTASIESDGAGNKFVDLRKADVYDILRIRDSDSDGVDLEGYFRFDNGQRDNFYDTGKLRLKSTFSAPTKPVFARFRYLSHGAGDFFDVTSYDSATTNLSYGQIPSYTLSSGATLSLRDHLDFRPRIGDLGTTFDSATASVRFLPKNTSVIRADVNYYLPRNDKLIISDNGHISILAGQSSTRPTYAATPANTLELYKIRMGANTLNESDVSTTFIDHKRYTMADIGKLENRIDRLEEYTTLSLLELQTSTWAVVDSSGIPRTKAGFLVDGFNDQSFCDTTTSEYRASVDFRGGVVRPLVIAKNIRLIYDSAASSNVILKGDNIYLAHTEAEYITQPFISTSENINPFQVITQTVIEPVDPPPADPGSDPDPVDSGGPVIIIDPVDNTPRTGIIALSPESDEWKETVYLANKVIDGGVKINTDQRKLFNEWQWQWQGQKIGSVVGTSSKTTREKKTWTETVRGRDGDQQVFRSLTEDVTTTIVSKIVSNETIREIVDDRVVDVAIIPWMRSRTISFTAKGLKPHTRHNVSFGGQNVSQWVKSSAFVRFATTTTDEGNLNKSATGIAGGATALESDENGRISGSFTIPNTESVRFRTGARRFVISGGGSSAAATYTATGLLETRQKDVLSTRKITIRSTITVTRKQVDPLAQSFVVDRPEGVFLTKVAVYFKSKPTNPENPTPVTLEIRPLNNGYPSSNVVVPGSIVTLVPSEVNLPAAETQEAVLAAPTFFEFEEPIYLNGNTEYSIVLLADTIDYNVYVSEMNSFVLGSTSIKIGQQPSLGSLFKSQNASTWEPDQNKDLAFKLYQAVFSTTPGYAILENADNPRHLLPANSILTIEGSRWAVVNHEHHGFDSGDTVNIAGLDSASIYSGVLGTSILGNKTVSFPDANGYQIYIDSAATATTFVGGTNVNVSNNIMYDIINPHIDFILPPSTSLSAQSKLTTGRSLAGTEIRFDKEVDYLPIAIKEDNYSDYPLMIANRTNELAAPMNGNRSATIRVNMSTASSITSPVIDMQRASLILVNNIIDKQDSDRSLDGFNTPLVFVPETHPLDGSHVAKHLTVPVTLATDAIGLQVVLGANRPADADFLVYYRTATTGENIRENNWVYTDAEVPMPSDDNPSVFREYRYLIGGRNGTLSPFTEYQLKIVFRSTNSSKVPCITDLRVIALAD